MQERFVTIIMAAGKGKRMNNSLPKVLHLLAGQPLVRYVIDLARKVGSERIILVVGHRYDLVEAATNEDGVEYVIQKKQLGTGDAVKVCQKSLNGYSGDVLVLSGDVPLMKAETVEAAWKLHRSSNAAVTVFTFKAEEAFGYGRIVRGDKNELLRIVEQNDASPQELQIKEVNAGIYFFKSDKLFQALSSISNNNASGEYYLTDTISVIKDWGEPEAAFLVEDPLEVAGVNTQEQLSDLENQFIERHPV